MMDTETRLGEALQLEIGAKLTQTEKQLKMQIAHCGVKRVCVQGFGSNPCLNANEKRHRHGIFCSMLG